MHFQRSESPEFLHFLCDVIRNTPYFLQLSQYTSQFSAEMRSKFFLAFPKYQTLWCDPQTLPALFTHKSQARHTLRRIEKLIHVFKNQRDMFDSKLRALQASGPNGLFVEQATLLESTKTQINAYDTLHVCCTQAHTLLQNLVDPKKFPSHRARILALQIWAPDAFWHVFWQRACQPSTNDVVWAFLYTLLQILREQNTIQRQLQQIHKAFNDIPQCMTNPPANTLLTNLHIHMYR
jgi:hypothetical protein